MKFLIDMPLSPELASWLARKGHDVIHVFQVDLASSSDEIILEYARVGVMVEDTEEKSGECEEEILTSGGKSEEAPDLKKYLIVF